MEVIISHVTADFDSLASMVAASKLYPQARLFFTSTPSQNVREFVHLYKDYFNIEYPRKVKNLEISKLIVVDTSLPDRVGAFKEFFISPLVEVHIYDHHPPAPESIQGDENYIEVLGATVTMLARKIREKKIPITPLEATLFALGIYEETGSLTFSHTTKEDVETVAYLLSKKANLKVISEYIHHSLSDPQIKLLNSLIVNSHVKHVRGFKILIARAHAKEFIDEISLVVHRLVDIEGVDIVFTLIKMKDKILIIGRSKQPEIDLSRILAPLGGGGHPNAASVVIKHKQMKTAEKRLYDTLEKELKPTIMAKDIMSSPVRYINLEEDKTIADAQKAIVRFGHSGLVILKDRRVAGIITRHDIDKAIHHGLANASIEEFMLKDVVTANPYTSLNTLQRIMTDHNIGRLPIIEDGIIKGIVTRTDILTTLHGMHIKAGRHWHDTKTNIEQLPLNMQKLFKTCSKIADMLGINIFLAGGFVRDLLLGIENLDIDIVVEGDGVLFAGELGKALKAKVITHEKFKTAIVFTKHCKVDVASTRVEYYTRPAALPHVWATSIKQDLYRRDFTINALAVQLNKKGFGSLLDFFGGQNDLKDGIVRVLHNLSFIEDPTRIFRAVRFEQRYHFKMDHHTEELLLNALKSNIFDQLTGERIRDEITLILSEEKPVPALKRMAKLNILKVIHKDIFLNQKLVATLQEATALMIKYKKILKKENAKKWIIYFMILVSQLSSEKIDEVAKRFKFSIEEVRKRKLDKDTASLLIRKLSSKTITKSQIYRLLSPLAIEALIYIIARTNFISVRHRIVYFLSHLKNIKFFVTGNDLIKWNYTPGPFFRKALTALEDAQIDGIIKDKKEARKYLKEKFKK
ncbi:MAG: CBS domain-containing protein [Armatimonadota bacterium]